MLALRSASTQYFSGRPVALQWRHKAGVRWGVHPERTQQEAGPEWGLWKLGVCTPRPMPQSVPQAHSWQASSTLPSCPQPARKPQSRNFLLEPLGGQQPV